MLRRLFFLLICLACAGSAQAADPISREQALHNLVSAEAPLRRAAVVRLAEVGRMEDAGRAAAAPEG